jgi:hypothetical protein
LHHPTTFALFSICWQHANVVAINTFGIADHSLPDVPSVPHHPEFPKRYFGVLQERAMPDKCLMVNTHLWVWLCGCGFVGMALTLPLHNSGLRA